MKPKDSAEITDLLKAWTKDESDADRVLLEAVYRELRRLARVFLASERDGHTLAPSDLIHEAYLRLHRRRQTPWQDRGHFFAAAAQCMRRILVEHARRHSRSKHGGGSRPLPLDEAIPLARERAPEIVALDEALQELATLDAFKGRLVELRFFGGFTIPETATILGCSHATVERHWRLAQTWLYAEMSSEDAAERPSGDPS